MRQQDGLLHQLYRSGAGMALQTSPRWPWLDVARAFAILMMITFHFCFDLMYWHLADFQLLTDWRWIAWRNFIVGGFLMIMGMSLVLAVEQTTARFWRRLVLITGCAGLISAVSWVMFAERFIYFGILHFVVLASLLGNLLLRLNYLNKRWLWSLLALICLATACLPGSDSLDPRSLNWLGMAAHKPQTEDYVPMLPWFGIVLLGMVLARSLHPSSCRGSQADLPIVCRPLAVLGRHSLFIYMLHQPLLMGLFWCYSAL
jgi:uncharacterized membrane protein